MDKTKIRMMVQLSDEGTKQIGSSLLTYAKQNSIGSFFKCEAVDPNGPYFYMLVDMGIDGEDGPNLELFVPHSYIRFYMRAQNEGQIGFIA
jgi:hypothetical protein